MFFVISPLSIITSLVMSPILRDLFSKLKMFFFLFYLLFISLFISLEKANFIFNSALKPNDPLPIIFQHCFRFSSSQRKYVENYFIQAPISVFLDLIKTLWHFIQKQRLSIFNIVLKGLRHSELFLTYSFMSFIVVYISSFDIFFSSLKSLIALILFLNSPKEGLNSVSKNKSQCYSPLNKAYTYAQKQFQVNRRF